MSAYIEFNLEINNIEILKKTLEVMNLKYEENTIANGYSEKLKADLVVRKKELKKFTSGLFGDMAFVFDEKENKYKVFVDDYDKEILTILKNIYAIETLKEYAKANRKELKIVSGDIFSTNVNEEIILTISE